MVVVVHPCEESSQYRQQHAYLDHAQGKAAEPVDDAETGKAEHFFEQVADECQHEDAYDEYHDEAQHGGELLARTEREIGKLEEKIAALDAESEKCAADYQKLLEIDSEKEPLNEELMALYEKWEALSQ